MASIASRPRADPLRMYRILQHFWIFYAFAAASVALALVVHGRSEAFLSRASTAQGTVVALGLESGRRSAAASPVFTFTDSAGKAWTIHSASGESPPGHVLGEKVTVVYAPGDPSGAQLQGESGSGTLEAFLLVSGAVHAMLASVGTWAWRSKFRHLPAFRG
jgi:hypothetical protein